MDKIPFFTEFQEVIRHVKIDEVYWTYSTLFCIYPGVCLPFLSDKEWRALQTTQQSDKHTHKKDLTMVLILDGNSLSSAHV